MILTSPSTRRKGAYTQLEPMAEYHVTHQRAVFGLESDYSTFRIILGTTGLR